MSCLQKGCHRKKFFGKSVPSDEQELLNAYILEGGFPYAIRLDSINDKRTYAQGLIDEIYKKDIQKRVIIRNRTVFDAVIKISSTILVPPQASGILWMT